MINATLNGICRALDGAFGGEIPIYTEAVEQGLQRPCFLVACTAPGLGRYLGRRHYLHGQYAVQYLPGDADARQACYAMATRLPPALEVIEAEGIKLLGTRMDASVAEGALHFFVHYDTFVYADDDSERMQRYTGKPGLKGG